jgi:hypothetical protein
MQLRASPLFWSTDSKKHPNELDGIEWPPNKERF